MKKSNSAVSDWRGLDETNGLQSTDVSAAEQDSSRILEEEAKEDGEETLGHKDSQSDEDVASIDASITATLERIVALDAQGKDSAAARMALTSFVRKKTLVSFGQA